MTLLEVLRCPGACWSRKVRHLLVVDQVIGQITQVVYNGMELFYGGTYWFRSTVTIDLDATFLTAYAADNSILGPDKSLHPTGSTIWAANRPDGIEVVYA